MRRACEIGGTSFSISFFNGFAACWRTHQIDHQRHRHRTVQYKGYQRPQNASVAVAGTVGAMGQALAQVAPVDITTVKTSIDSAGSQGTTVGGYIIGAIAVLAGIGVIIAVVKKL